MERIQSIGRKVEKFIVERDSFSRAVQNAFRTADIDGNGVLAPREVAAMSDTMFDFLEQELASYGIEFQRPTTEQVKTFLEVADKNDDYVLDQDEFFDFYRQVVKYCAVVSTKKAGRAYLPKIIGGICAVWGIKFAVSKVPAASDVAAPILQWVSPFVVGPLLGILYGYVSMRSSDGKLKKDMFTADRTTKQRK